MTKTIIIGAGLTGLSIAFKLSSMDNNLILLEKENYEGGHVFSTNLGNFHIDLGPHIFRSKEEAVMKFVKELLNFNFINIESKPRIFKYGKIFENVIPVIPKKNIDMLSKIKNITYTFKKVESQTGNNFEEIMINWIGYDLYWEFFGEYSEKWWGLKGKLLDPVLVPKALYIGDKPTYSHYTVNSGYTEEIYPKDGGFMTIARALAQNVFKRNVKKEYNKKVTHFENKDLQMILTIRDSNNVEKEIVADKVYYTGSLDTLISDMKVNINLNYRGIIFGGFLFRGNTQFEKYSWLYLHEKRLLAARVYDAKYYHPQLRNSECTAIVIEIPSNPNDGKWEFADKICDKAFEELVGEGLIKLSTNSFKGDIVNKVTIRDPYSYPLFKLDYKNEYNRLVKFLSEKFPKLRLEGRNAKFEYLNSNNIIEKYIFSDYLVN
ncbi:hypothetical protein B9Q01_09885 [Candidatus Marsarchaeota G1 archaeon OSP_D]|jgi:Protoporphyrinogen oxidase|uniref:Amine oxidase domain-containing protein n=1 Tax=Candidatus Marsarchaeota G1 archaeon OSP_D TaxID=1978155 RepID=A0A2R6A629_9ARCH|nr:MAG: hypothetical protein B9Q01_09885 [Candidatus Marsarchaeota G1 archaeon OSP_D]